MIKRPKHAEVTIQIDALLAQSMKELTILRALCKHLLLSQPGHRITVSYADLSAAYEGLSADIRDDGQAVTMQLGRPEVPAA